MAGQSNPCRLLAALNDVHPDAVDMDTLAVLPGLGLNRRQISDAAGVLERLGFASRPEPGRYQLTGAGVLALKQAVTITGGPNGPNQNPRHVKNTLRARIWRALRIKQKASLTDLLTAATTDADRQPENNARTYLSALRRAGYVVVLARREPGIAETSNGFKKWLLLRDSGPQAPIYRERYGEVFDPNTGERWPLTTDAEQEVA